MCYKLTKLSVTMCYTFFFLIFDDIYYMDSTWKAWSITHHFVIHLAQYAFKEAEPQLNKTNYNQFRGYYK